MIQLIYMSEPFGYDDNILKSILAAARLRNARDEITGALICRQDIYLQLIEGDEEAIDALFARILADDRHLAVRRLNRVEVSDRLFPQWAMRHDPAQTWLWSAEEVRNGAVQQATPEALQQVFVRASTEADGS